MASDDACSNTDSKFCDRLESLQKATRREERRKIF